MHTYLQEKNATANILGRTDGATPNTIRDNAINNSRQEDIANAYPFSWLEVKTTLSIDASGQADLPENFNISHKSKISDASDFEMFSTDKSLFDGTVSEKAFYIDRNTSTDRWRINTNLESVTVKTIYYQIPATLTDDATIDIIPDLKVIAYFAAATYWLSSERDETNSDRFFVKAEKRLRSLILIDKRSQPRIKRSAVANLGWNKND